MDAVAVRPDQSSRIDVRSAAQWWWLPVGVAAAYYLGCQAGFALRFPESGIAVLWPPTAVLTAALILTDSRSWLGLLASTFVAHAVAHSQDGVPAAAWPVLFIGNAMQAALAAYIVRRYTEPTRLFADAPRTLIFIGGACFAAPAVSSLMPAYVYASMGWADEFQQAWRARTISNAIASLTLIPIFTLLWQYVLDRPRVSARRAVEYAVLLVGILAARLAHTGARGSDDLFALAVALYAPVPFLLWATVRFGGGGLSLAVLWTTVLTMFSVLRGDSPFDGRTPIETVMAVQLFIAANAIPMMVIAGLLERNRQEHAALQDMERQNKAILRTLPDLMFVQTRDGRVQRCYASGGYELVPSPHEAVGRHIGEVLPAPLSESVSQAVRGATADAPSMLECLQTVGGVPRRYEARFIAIDHERVLTIVRDITKRWRAESMLREARERYALATEAGGLGVWDFNVQTGEVHVEGRLPATLGYADAEIGNSLAEWEGLIHPHDRDTVHAHLMRVVEGSSEQFDEELRVMHKDGSVRWLVVKGTVTDRSDGVPSRIIGTYADVTARKEAERARDDANDALARSGRITAFAQLSASISHELNQPLAAIATNVTACLRWLESGNAKNGDLKEVLDDVMRNSERASAIMERTRAMFANRPVRKTALDLNDAVRGILDIARVRLRDSDVRQEVDLGASPMPILADEIQIQQVLLNLIGNGVDAMKTVPRRSRVLRVSVRRGKRHAAVSVRDAGHGFGPDGVKRIFEPFYTTKESGTGMGLTISRSIVEAHGGSLWAIANRDVGATVRFKLPLSDQPEAVHEVVKRVLIVDDHEDLRVALGRLVAAWGYEVAVATDGKNALQVAETFHPQFAVVDLMLPDMGGIELAGRLRKAQKKPGLHLVALTAMRGEDVRQRCLSSGFDSFLIKPEGISSLEALLKRSA